MDSTLQGFAFTVSIICFVFSSRDIQWRLLYPQPSHFLVEHGSDEDIQVSLPF